MKQRKLDGWCRRAMGCTAWRCSTFPRRGCQHMSLLLSSFALEWGATRSSFGELLPCTL